MKKQIYILVSFLFICLIGFSQTPSQNKRDMMKYYNQGDYVNATLKAIDYLRVKPKNKKAQQTLSTAFNMAIEDINADIDDLKDKNKIFIGDGSVNDYYTIISKYKLLKKLDRNGREIVMIIHKKKAPLKFNRVNVMSDLESAKRTFSEYILLAADMHYKKGINLMNNHNRESQKLAAKEFKKASNYVPGYKDSQTLYKQARKNGTTRVAILPFVNKSGENRYGSVGEMISDKLKSDIMNNKEASEFIEIFTRDQLYIVLQEQNLNKDSGIIDKNSIAKAGKILGINMIITGKVMQLTVENRQTINDGARVNTVSVVVGTEKYLNNKGKVRYKNIYSNVTAENFYHHKSAIASINGSYSMIDIESGRTLASSDFNEQYKWVNNWATYSGDQRAAKTPYNYDNGEIATPSKTELANKVIDILGNKISQGVFSLIK